MMSELQRITVHDVDECLTNSVKKHFQLTAQTALMMGFAWPEAQLPKSYKELCDKGGTHNAYGQFSGYLLVNELLRNDLAFNMNQEFIEGSLEALTLLRKLRLFDFYLTTRPASLAQATLRQLTDAGFPEGELIARPEDVPVEKTSQWKLWVLEERQKVDGRPKLMIDDSVSMLRAIEQRQHEKINGILHKGPITPSGSGEMEWKEIVDILSGAQTWNALIQELSQRRLA